MPGRVTEISEQQDVFDLQKELARLRRALAASQMPTWTHDIFTAPATYQLTYIPYGINVLADNGVALSEGTDYTIDYTTGLITFTTGRTAGHVIYVSYVTTGDLTALSGPVDFGSIADTFNRANSASTVNPASDGGTWTDDAGAFGINGNAAYSFGAGSGTFWDFSGKVIHRDLHSAVQVVQVDVLRAVSGNNSRLYLNLSTGSPGSAYALVWNVGNDFKLYKSFSNGTATTLIAGPISAGSLLGAYHTIKGTSDGAGTLRFYVDGTHIAGLDYTDGSPLTGTRVGLGLYTGDTGTNFLFDNFSALPS